MLTLKRIHLKLIVKEQIIGEIIKRKAKKIKIKLITLLKKIIVKKIKDG
jgi:hypothetical protein